MPRHQCHAQFLALSAETKIDVTQMAAVIALVVWHNAELENLLFEILRGLIDGPRMNRTRGDVDHTMAAGNIQSQSNLVAIASDHELDPRAIAETLRRRCYPGHLDSSQR